MPKRKEKITGCPVDAFLKLTMGQWSAYILWQLELAGPTRFGELKRKIPGISSKVLTDKLRNLERANLIYRDYQATIPPTVTYGLTERGNELRDLLRAISDLAFRWQNEKVFI